MKKLGVAVVGIGFWGRNHVRVFSELPETELKAVCDINSEKAQTAAEKLGVEGYTDSEKAYRRSDIDAVSICTWSTNLASEAMKALRAGKHVFVEKPMASNVQQAKRIVGLAKRKDCRLMVGLIERFNPGVQRIKEAVEKGEIGTPVSATARRVSEWPERIGDVGVVKDTAIHDIDVIVNIFAEDPLAVYAKAGNLMHTRFEDYAHIMLTFESGKTAFIESNWLTPYKTRRLIVTGSRAMMTLDYLTQEIMIETAGQSLKPRYKWEEPLKMELQHFVNCVLEGREPSVTGVDGLKALQIAEAALKSAAKCRTIKLK